MSKITFTMGSKDHWTSDYDWTNVSGLRYNTRMKQNWFKYTYVCSICDALIEITNKTNIYAPHICCGQEAIWMSVVDATIHTRINSRGKETNA